MIKRALLAFLFCLVSAAAAAAPAILPISTKHCSAATICALTTATNDCPVGSMGVLFVSTNSGTSTIVVVSDSAGNSWNPIRNDSGNGVTAAWAVAPNTNFDLPIGGTITIQLAGGTAGIGMIAGCVSGANTLDGNQQTITNTGPSAASSAALNSGPTITGNVLLLGGIAIGAGATLQNCTGTINLQFQTQVTSAAAGVCQVSVVASGNIRTMAETWTTAGAYVQSIIGVYQGVAGKGQLLLTGLGK